MNNMLKIRCTNSSFYLIRKDKILSMHLICDIDPEKFWHENMLLERNPSVSCIGKYCVHIRLIDSDLATMLTVPGDEFVRLSNVKFQNPLNKKKRIKRRRFGGTR